MYKQAKILTQLQPHQQRALERGLKNNLILAHSTGSGKTLTAIALADALGKPTTVLTPASLVENFKKELKKHKKGGPPVNVMSLPTAVSRNIAIPKGNTLILDEAHAFRNLGTARQQYIKAQLANADRVFALTGTPNYNDIADIARLANIVAKERILPESDIDFRDRYIKNIKIQPSWWDRVFHDVQPGELKVLKNENDLRARLRPYIDVFDTDIEKPKRIDETIKVPMTGAQTALYNKIGGHMPRGLFRKLQLNLPPSKQEASSLNSFLGGVRQVSNTTEQFDTSLIDQPKLERAVDELVARRERNKKLRALVYSTYLDSGIGAYAKLLDKKGVPYARFDGSLSQKAKKQIVEDYNSGKVPVILGSGSASEVLDLKNTRLIQILEPHFNESKIDQVIGRGIRYKSHSELPEEDRNVTVQKFYSVFPNSDDTAVDEYLASRAKEKADLAAQLKRVIAN
jgi:SNF2 family DNA or RNA helicase